MADHKPQPSSPPASLSPAPSSVRPMEIDGSDHDLVLSASEYLTRCEVLKRRSRRVKQLSRLYKEHYWAMMEDVKTKYKEFYWLHGKSPFKEDEVNNPNGTDGKNENLCENGNGQRKDCVDGNRENDEKYGGVGIDDDDGIKRCVVAGCKTKAMALTRFCHQHILSDSKQSLYKACSYVIKSVHTGPLLCGKPILKTTTPSYCTPHFQTAERHLARALKKAGFNAPSTSKVAPKFHCVVAEFVNQVQDKRRAAPRVTIPNAQIKEEKNC